MSSKGKNKQQIKKLTAKSAPAPPPPEEEPPKLDDESIQKKNPNVSKATIIGGVRQRKGKKKHKKTETQSASAEPPPAQEVCSTFQAPIFRIHTVQDLPTCGTCGLNAFVVSQHTEHSSAPHLPGCPVMPFGGYNGTAQAIVLSPRLNYKEHIPCSPDCIECCNLAAHQYAALTEYVNMKNANEDDQGAAAAPPNQDQEQMAEENCNRLLLLQLEALKTYVKDHQGPPRRQPE